MRSVVCRLLTTGAIVVLHASGMGAQGLKMDQVMTPAQLRTTGVASLTPSQRVELDRWLNEFAARVLQVAQSAPPAPPATAGSTYAGVGSGHWVKKVSNGGRLVELEDGSLWEINAVDRIDTMLWLPVTDITVTVARSPIGDYKYTLINKDDGETALAKFLGK